MLYVVCCFVDVVVEIASKQKKRKGKVRITVGIINDKLGFDTRRGTPSSNTKE